MNQPPQPSTYGQVKTFLKTLYEELLQSGYEQPDLYGVSLSNALLAWYGSSEAVGLACITSASWLKFHMGFGS